MSFVSVMKDTEFDNELVKEEYVKMARLFERGLPDMLYQDPYELHNLTGIHHERWKAFLKLPTIVQAIETEIALMAEIKARAALQKLGDGDLDSSDVAAIKALLDKSKLLQGKLKENRTVIFHHIPLEEREEENAIHSEENK